MGYGENTVIDAEFQELTPEVLAKRKAAEEAQKKLEDTLAARPDTEKPAKKKLEDVIADAIAEAAVEPTKEPAVVHLATGSTVAVNEPVMVSSEEPAQELTPVLTPKGDIPDLNLATNGTELTPEMITQIKVLNSKYKAWQKAKAEKKASRKEANKKKAVRRAKNKIASKARKVRRHSGG